MAEGNSNTNFSRQDSYAPVLYDAMYSRLGYPNEDYGRFPVNQMLQSLTITRKVRGVATGTLTLFDRNETFLVGTKRPGQGSGFILKWTWANTGLNVAQMPAYRMQVVRVVPNFSVEGTGLTFDLTGRFIPFNATQKGLAPRKFDAGQTASEIVKQICAELKWPVSAIEDSYGKLPAFVLGDESHHDFIMNRILPLAHNDSGEHFEFYTDDPTGGVHFHSRSYVVRIGRRRVNGSSMRAVAREYTFARDATGEVESFAPHDNSFFAAIAGGGDGRVTGIDSQRGRPVSIDTSVRDGLPVTTIDSKPKNIPLTGDEQAVSSLALGPASSISTPESEKKNVTAFTGLIARTPEEAQRLAVNLWSMLRNTAYMADATVKGTHDVEVGDWVIFHYYTYQQGEHFLSGLFRVNEITHTLDSGGWKTSFKLTRAASKPSSLSSEVRPGGYVPIPIQSAD